MLRRDRTNSRSSDASSLSDSSTSSPKFKRSSKLKFIKNIKPETFKRPSSTFTKEQDVKGAVAGAREPDKCQLVGYRKRDSNTFAPIMELGTLSPAQPERTVSVLKDKDKDNISLASSSSLHNAASLPTLVGEGGLSLVSSGSMPELNRTNSFRRSKELKPKLSGGNLEHQLKQARIENLEQRLREAAAGEGKEKEDVAPTETISASQIEIIEKAQCNAHSNPAQSDDAQNDPNHHSDNEKAHDDDNDVPDSSEESKAESLPIPPPPPPPACVSGEKESPLVPNNDNNSSSQSSPDGIEIAINGIELEPELTNDEILTNFREHKDKEENTGGSNNYRELSVDDIPASSADSSSNTDVATGSTDQQQCTILELLKDEFRTSQQALQQKDKDSSGKLGMARLDTTVTTQPPRSEFSLLPGSSSPDRSHLLVSPVADETIK